jgi:protein-S-isoprenylcysteine O-methyltransferase Ste14
MTVASVDRWQALPYSLVPVVAGAAGVFLGVLDPVRLTGGLYQSLGIVPLLGGIGVVGWTVYTMSLAGETLSPVGDSDTLVTTGPYAQSRNPMYLGVVLTVFGTAVLAGSPLVTGYGTLLGVTYHCIIITLEEPKLRETFGNTYECYCEEVPRWLPTLRDRV